MGDVIPEGRFFTLSTLSYVFLAVKYDVYIELLTMVARWRISSLAISMWHCSELPTLESILCIETTHTAGCVLSLNLGVLNYFTYM